MKNTIKLLLPALVMSATAANAQAIIEGKIKGLEAGTKVYMQPLTSSGKVDSTEATAGAFSLQASAETGDIYLLRVGKDRTAENGSLLFYLEPGKLQVTGNGPLLKDITYKGPAYAADLNSLNALSKLPVFKEKSALSKQMNEAYKVKDTVLLAKLQKDYPKLDSSANLVYEAWIDKHKGSPLSAFVLSFYLRYRDMEKLEARYKELEPSAKKNAVAKKMQHSIDAAKATAIGKLAPEFTQNDTLGKPVALKDLRGKYVLIDFWASWCVPCRHENPAVVKAFNEYKDKNFTVLGVSLDRPDDKDKWIKAIHDDGLTWTHVSDLNWWDNAVSRLYDIRSIPANYLLDPEGKIVAKNLRGEDLEKKLAEVLK
ncbi:TlpA disulfide reductase family protein [uncultured Chitinophaga sp.]|uniref:TlpA disulfide reductase family protein n=1 Tax=uncultured Chitinophaga sp. TaxID=339340 RepID=UPI0025FA2F3D|nr:TlpA disulfide reductase family protein [uncultured Chitinophaga sp.]